MPSNARARRARAANRAVEAALAAAFVVLLATPVTYGAVHEWVGMASFALTVAHIVLSRKRLGALVRSRRVGAWAALALDAALLACIVGQAASSIVLSEHVLAWAPAVPGAAWARKVHLACGYWGFLLAFAHAGTHLRAFAGKSLRDGAANVAWGVALAVCLVFGAMAFWRLNLVAYLTLSVEFVFVDPTVPLWRSVLDYVFVAGAVAGLSCGATSLVLCAGRGSRSRGES